MLQPSSSRNGCVLRCMWNLKLKWIEIENLLFGISSSAFVRRQFFCSFTVLLFCVSVLLSCFTIFHNFFFWSIACLSGVQLRLVAASSVRRTCACYNFLTTRNAPNTSNETSFICIHNLRLASLRAWVCSLLRFAYAMHVTDAAVMWISRNKSMFRLSPNWHFNNYNFAV